MCSCASVSSVASNTWVASVPPDLTDTIAAAVGVQPVRAQAPLKLLVQEQQPACTPQQTTAAGSNSSHGIASQIDALHGCKAAKPDNCNAPGPGVRSSSCCGRVSPTTSSKLCSSEQPVPVRRPTMAEVRAASPVSCNDLEQLAGSSISSSRTPSLEADQQAYAASQPGVCSDSRWTAAYDDMDDAQTYEEQLLEYTQHSRQSSLSELDLSSVQCNQQQQYFEAESSSYAWQAVDTHTKVQQQLFCQLWAQLQLPVQIEQDLQAHPQCCDIAVAQQPAGSNSSSCCSDDESHSSAWPVASSSLDSSCYSPTAALSTASSMISSRASSICSRRSSGEKHVTWGTVTEYQLPPEPQCSWLWAVCSNWLQRPSSLCSKQRSAGCSKAEAALAGAAAAGLVVAIAGAAALAYARRSTAA